MHGDVVPREAQDAVAGELEVGVAGRVLLAIAAGAVIGEAVELDDQPVRRPEGIDLVRVALSVDQHVELRRGEAGVTDELLEERLELASVSAGRHPAMACAERLGASLAPRTREHVLDGREVEDL